MLLTTEKLRIVPLTPRQLGLWLHDIPALGKELDCRCTAGSPRGDFRRIVEGQYALAAADPVNHLFHTFWSYGMAVPLRDRPASKGRRMPTEG